MSSTRLFDLLVAPATTAPGTILTTTQISALAWTRIPLNSLLSDFNITEGEALTVQNIGGSLKDDWTQPGFTSVEGEFRQTLPDSDGLASVSEKVLDAWGTSRDALDIGKTITPAWDEVDFGSCVAGTYASDTFTGMVRNASTGAISFGVFKGLDTAGTFRIVSTVDEPVTVETSQDYDITERNADEYVHILAVASNGVKHLILHAKLNTMMNITEPSAILELITKAPAIQKHPSNYEAAYQAAMIVPDGCAEHKNGVVSNLSEAYIYDRSEFQDFSGSFSSSAANTITLHGNGFVGLTTAHARDLSPLEGNAAPNGKVAIEETANSIKFNISVYLGDLELSLRKKFRAGDVFGFFARSIDGRLAFHADNCKFSGMSNAEDSNGIHTVSFTVECNQACSAGVFWAIN